MSLPRPQSLPTSLHNESDILTYMEPLSDRGIMTIDTKEDKDDAIRLITQAVVFDECSAGRGSTIDTRGNFRLDNQGDKPKNGKKFANLQLQKGDRSVAAALIEIGIKFGQQRIRRALCDSMKYTCIVQLERKKKLNFLCL